MFDASGAVVSGIWSNVFVVSDGKLVTPLLEGAGVEGTIRRFILETVAPALNIPVAIKRLVLEEVLEADEVFLSNSLIGVRPVGLVGKQQWSPGPVTLRLQRKLAVESLEHRGV